MKIRSDTRSDTLKHYNRSAEMQLLKTSHSWPREQLNRVQISRDSRLLLTIVLLTTRITAIMYLAHDIGNV